MIDSPTFSFSLRVQLDSLWQGSLGTPICFSGQSSSGLGFPPGWCHPPHSEGKYCGLSSYPMLLGNLLEWLFWWELLPLFSPRAALSDMALQARFAFHYILCLYWEWGRNQSYWPYTLLMAPLHHHPTPTHTHRKPSRFTSSPFCDQDIRPESCLRTQEKLTHLTQTPQLTANQAELTSAPSTL